MKFIVVVGDLVFRHNDVNDGVKGGFK